MLRGVTGEFETNMYHILGKLQLYYFVLTALPTWAT